jgi:AcrR family transcriptional regulator
VPATDTRRRVLDAALAGFLEDGYAQTTIADIRSRSEVSNGALFHHFPSKEAIADALFVEAISSFHEGLWRLVARKPRSLRSAVRGVIEHQLRWIEEHPDLARFVYMRGHLDWDSEGGSEVVELNRRIAAAIRTWMAPLVSSGEIRPRSMLVISAIVTGPAHAIAQRWLAGQIDSAPTAYVDELADAAWAGLRGKPAGGRTAPAAPAERSRLALELIGEDGAVLAQGEARLVPAGDDSPS